MEPDPRWVFYLLRSGNGRRTYTGITTNPARRIRCHRGEIKGGAKWPLSWKDGCEFVLQIRGFGSKSATLSFEYYTKAKGRRRAESKLKFKEWFRELQTRTGKTFPGSGVAFRTLTILHLLTLEKWRKLGLEIEWLDERYEYLGELVSKNFKDPEPSEKMENFSTKG